MKILGVDPGIRGGLAIVDLVDGAAPRLIAVVDVPVIGVGAKERVDVAAVCDFIKAHQPQHAIVERAQAMPKQGSSSGFKYGRGVGSLEAAITCSGIPTSVVEPSKWKRHYQLPGGDKESARQRAMQLLPSAHAMLARRRDHNRAEAMLLALYGATLTSIGGTR